MPEPLRPPSPIPEPGTAPAFAALPGAAFQRSEIPIGGAVFDPAIRHVEAGLHALVQNLCTGSCQLPSGSPVEQQFLRYTDRMMGALHHLRGMYRLEVVAQLLIGESDVPLYQGEIFQAVSLAMSHWDLLERGLLELLPDNTPLPAEFRSLREAYDRCREACINMEQGEEQRIKAVLAKATASGGASLTPDERFYQEWGLLVDAGQEIFSELRDREFHHPHDPRKNQTFKTKVSFARLTGLLTSHLMLYHGTAECARDGRTEEGASRLARAQQIERDLPNIVASINSEIRALPALLPKEEALRQARKVGEFVTAAVARARGLLRQS